MNYCPRCAYHTEQDVCPYCGDFIGDNGPDPECEHNEVDDGFCLECGKEIEQYDPRMEPEYRMER